MSMKTINDEETLDINNLSSDVKLNVTVGNAGLSGTSVKWKDDPNNELADDPTNVERLSLGKGSFCTGKTLIIETTIKTTITKKGITTNDFSNATPAQIVERGEVDDLGDLLRFHLEVNFK